MRREEKRREVKRRGEKKREGMRREEKRREEKKREVKKRQDKTRQDKTRQDKTRLRREEESLQTTVAAFNAEFGICPLCIPIGESQSSCKRKININENIISK